MISFAAGLDLIPFKERFCSIQEVIQLSPEEQEQFEGQGLLPATQPSHCQSPPASSDFVKTLKLLNLQSIFKSISISTNSQGATQIMKNITYKAKLSDLALLVPTNDYTNPELAENLLEFGVTAPIVFTTNGAKSRFGMKELIVKDGAKRLNLAASNPEIGKLIAQVILIENSSSNFIRPMEINSPAENVDSYIYQNSYSWKNEQRNISEYCTANELGKKYGIRVQYLNTVIKGKTKCTRGWSLAQN